MKLKYAVEIENQFQKSNGGGKEYRTRWHTIRIPTSKLEDPGSNLGTARRPSQSFNV